MNKRLKKNLEDQNKYAVTYVSFSKGGPVVSIAMTDDFIIFERLGCILPPEDKDASLFPHQIGGRYVLIHRPIIRGEAHIWISFSPDLKYWGEHRVLLSTRPGWWDNHRVGLGPPPIETPQGWLIIYHGVRITASGSLYRVGLALLDRDDPCQIIHRSENWVFGPRLIMNTWGMFPESPSRLALLSINKPVICECIMAQQINPLQLPLQI